MFRWQQIINTLSRDEERVLIKFAKEQAIDELKKIEKQLKEEIENKLKALNNQINQANLSNIANINIREEITKLNQKKNQLQDKS